MTPFPSDPDTAVPVMASPSGGQAATAWPSAHGKDEAAQVPKYLKDVYWWAYVHPKAVDIFERDWLVNAILWGNYNALVSAAVQAMGSPITGHVLQVACAYGNLTPKLQAALAPDASLDVVDILPVQLSNLAAKLPPDDRVALLQGDSSKLTCESAVYDKVLLFFLLHEQPQDVRRRTLSEAMRVLKPGGQLVIVDYHGPSRWHPLRPLMYLVLKTLEPFAMDLWHNEVLSYLSDQPQAASVTKTTHFGGLYQKLVIQK